MEVMVFTGEARLGGKLISMVCVALAACLFCVCEVCAAEVSGGQFTKKFDLQQDPEPLLKEILQRPEFKNHSALSWLDRLRLWLREVMLRALAWMLRRLSGLGPVDLSESTGTLIVRGLLFGSVAVAGAVLLWLVVKLFMARRRGAEQVSAARDSGQSEHLGSAHARAKALRLAEEGNYREALIYTFRFVLLWLDEKGRLSIGPGKTNGEVLHSALQQEPLRAFLAQMIPVFNSVRYGDAACGKKDYEHFAALSSRLTEGTFVS